MTIRHIDKDGIPFKHATVSQAATTLYVRSTGNDSNVGTLASPLLTIQAAIDRIPKFIDHAFTIDIGAGSFAKFDFVGRALGSSGLVTIKGAMKTATVATGTATGTSTSGTTFTLTDSGQTWTTNDLRGKWVTITGWNPLMIASNTTTQITIAGRAGEAMTGKAYTIQDNATTVPAGSSYYAINIGSNSGGYIILQNLKADATGQLFGVMTSYNNSAVYAQYMYLLAGSYGVSGVINPGAAWLDNCYLKSNTSNGVSCSDGSYLKISGALLESCGASGSGAIFLEQIAEFISDVHVISGSGVGLKLSNCRAVKLGRNTFSSNAQGGMYLLSSFASPNPDSSFGDEGSLFGTGNTGWGAKIDRNSYLGFRGGGVSTLTGTLGDLTMDDLTPVTWASFSSTGDSVVNPNTLSRVERSA